VLTDRRLAISRHLQRTDAHKHIWPNTFPRIKAKSITIVPAWISLVSPHLGIVCNVLHLLDKDPNCIALISRTFEVSWYLDHFWLSTSQISCVRWSSGRCDGLFYGFRQNTSFAKYRVSVPSVEPTKCWDGTQGSRLGRWKPESGISEDGVFNQSLFARISKCVICAIE
jgi:hypothetical protein